MYNKIELCRLCASTKLQDILSLGVHPLSGRFPKEDEPEVAGGPLSIQLCLSCGLLQLEHDYLAEELFKVGYGYRSGLNDTMKSHLSGLVEALGRRVTLSAGDVVMDIGSNDATLLRSYQISRLKLIGVDPLIGQFQEFYPKEIIQISELFCAESFLAVSDRGAKAISTIAMFYDLPKPNKFVSDLSRCLSQDGVWVTEQSYVLKMLERNSFDTICHEHLEYYGLSQIYQLAKRHGLRVFDVEFNDINGGSFRVYLCHDDAEFETNDIVHQTIDNELVIGLRTLEPYKQFVDRINMACESLVDFLQIIKNQGKSIYLYGASTKGNTLLNYCGIGTDLITAAADRNPEKWGRRTPGTNIPIISEKTARSNKPDYFLVLPWHFRDEFVKRERDFLEAGGKMIFPLPKFQVV